MIKDKLILAPMAGVCDRAFRIICEQFGADYTVSEMVSAKALTYGDKKTAALMDVKGQKKPCAIQLFGHEPAILSEGARLALSFKPAWIDINMGCPAPKIVKSGDGSALMKNPKLIYEITAAVRDALPPEIPVAVKLRAGYTQDSINAVECAHMAERGGAAFLTVHGRTREQFYAPPVNWNIIRSVKKEVNIPVVGNGDVVDGPSAAALLRESGCDALMIGRGALGRPYIFEEIRAYLRGEPYEEPNFTARLGICRKHISLLIEEKGEHTGMLEARKHLAWYFKGLRGGAKLRARAHQITAFSELDTLLTQAIELQYNKME